jgi:hypothetical protein
LRNQIIFDFVILLEIIIVIMQNKSLFNFISHISLNTKLKHMNLIFIPRFPLTFLQLKTLILELIIIAKLRQFPLDIEIVLLYF